MIEPLSSVMSVQAQNTAVQKPVATERVSEVPVDAAKAVDVVDKTTSIVENAQSKKQSNNSAEQEQPSQEQIRKAVEKLNKSLPNSSAIFGIHEATNRVTIKIVDKDTKEVLKELPPEKTLDMIAKVWELAGILVDEKR